MKHMIIKIAALVSIGMMLSVAVSNARGGAIVRVSKRVLSARVFSTNVAKPKIGLKDRYKNFMNCTSDPRFFTAVTLIASAPSISIVGCAAGQPYGQSTKGSVLGLTIPLYAGIFFLAPLRTVVATAGFFGAGYTAYRNR